MYQGEDIFSKVVIQCFAEEAGREECLEAINSNRCPFVREGRAMFYRCKEVCKKVRAPKELIRRRI
ncbi:MAG: hypothetical protein EOM84_03435 [Sphingobacteriia bacterium]|jgi:hypothetical protein|nr:hypothetical protein [Sphingobacteriia bacterium]